MAHRAEASSSWRRCGGQAVDLGADVVHRAAADAGVEQACAAWAPSFWYSAMAASSSESFADEAVEAPERVALRRGAVVHEELAQAVRGGPTLGTAAL